MTSSGQRVRWPSLRLAAGWATSVLETIHTEDSVHHIEMHPGNRVLFVFQDGHIEERFWKDHSRRDSWDAENRQKAAEKTRIQHQKRKEQEQ